MLAMVVVPFLAAYVMWTTGIGMPVSTTNKGELISPPLHVDGLTLETAEQKRVDHRFSEGRWVLMVAGNGECNELCQNALYLGRQVHIALGREAHRVVRYYVELADTVDAELEEQLNSEHPKLVLLKAKQPAFVSYFDGLVKHPGSADLKTSSVLGQGLLFVIDPLGNIMLYFTPEHSGKDILADLERLLSASKVG